MWLRNSIANIEVFQRLAKESIYYICWILDISPRHCCAFTDFVVGWNSIAFRWRRYKSAAKGMLLTARMGSTHKFTKSDR